MKPVSCKRAPECQHEVPPWPQPGRSGFVERDHALNPAGLESIVPCIHCGIPINRGRYSGHLIDPEWAREKGIPTDRYPNLGENT